MDPTRRLCEHERFVPLTANPQFITAAIVGSFLIPSFLYALVAGDAQIVYETWEWRHGVRANAEITAHEYVVRRHKGIAIGEPYHKIAYRFQVNEREVSGNLEIPSPDVSSVNVFERVYAMGPNASIPVFYLPDKPTSHTVFVDPRATFEDSAKRLGWLALIAVSGGLIVVLVAICYRPAKPDRSLLPEKIDVSEIKINT